MRRILLVIVLLGFLPLATPALAARDIDRFVSGSWFNPGQNGHGFSIEYLADGQVLIYWYTYHPDGSPTFLLAVGTAVGNKVTAQAYYNTGMRFGSFDPDDRTETPWGTITLTLHDCQSATIAYDSTFEHAGLPFGSGSFSIQRLVTIDQLECQDDARAGIYEGTFFSSLDNATYYGFVLVAPGGAFAAYSDGGMAAFGTANAVGGNIQFNGTAVSLVPEDPFASDLSGSGNIAPEYRLYSTYSVEDGDSGSGDFYSSPALYRRMVTPASLAGSYSVGNPVTGASGEATIAANGNVTGSDELGCQYSGDIDIPDTRFNLFEVTVTISSCPGYNGTYEGLGSRVDWYVVGDSRGLRVLISDGEFAFVLLAVK